MQNSLFSLKAPITKSWEQEVEVSKGINKVEKSNQRFVEVAVSGLKEDRDGEMMSQEAIDDMISQFKSGSIPFFPDHGRDEKTGAQHVYSWKQIMGVWVDARQEGDKLLATLRLNKAHADQETFWNYVQEGMPLGFSIGGSPAEEPKFIEMEVEDVELEKGKKKHSHDEMMNSSDDEMERMMNENGMTQEEKIKMREKRNGKKKS